MEPIVSVTSGAMGRRIRIATNTANPTDICLAWPAGVTLSCTQNSSIRGQLVPAIMCYIDQRNNTDDTA